MRLYTYQGERFPEYLKSWNVMQFIAPAALKFCQGRGLDVGAGKWPLPGSIPVELEDGGDANGLPPGPYDYVFSSHCLEHLVDYVHALRHWKSRIRPGGVLYLYLPHPDMLYWRPENCAKHRHMFWPRDVASTLRTLGFVDVIHSERDMAWSFSVVGFVPESS